MAADETSYTSFQFVHMLCPIWLTKPLLGERGEFNIAYSIEDCYDEHGFSKQ